MSKSKIKFQMAELSPQCIEQIKTSSPEIAERLMQNVSCTLRGRMPKRLDQASGDSAAPKNSDLKDGRD